MDGKTSSPYSVLRIGIMFSLGAANASAQTPAGADNANAQIDTIVVTAQRREQLPVEVPMALSVLSSLELEKRGIKNFVDYAVAVPSVSFGFSGTEARGSRNTIAIRGVSGTNTTGYYIDDTPIPFGVDPRLFDIERVEILRGPQGTLFGSGSMGGTIRVITTEPESQEFVARGITDFSYTQKGSGNVELAAIQNFPLIRDQLGMRLTAYYEHQSGIFNRIFGEPLPYYPQAPTTPSFLPESGVEQNFDTAETSGLRAALHWRPTPELEVIPSIFWEKRQEAGASQADSKPGEFDQHRVWNIPEPFDDQYWLANLTLRYDLGSADFASTTSYFSRNWKEVEDGTEVIDTFFRSLYANPEAPPFPMPLRNDRRQDRWVQELRLTGTTGSFDWLVGGFAQWFDTRRTASLIPQGMGTHPDYFDFGVDDIFFVSDDSNEVRELALFTDVTWNLTRRLDVSAGARLFENRIIFNRDSGGLFDAGLELADLKQSETGITPRAAIRYMLTPNASVYVSTAKGFRTGGNNTPLPPTCDPELEELDIDTPETYDSDTLWNYEIGTKADLFGGAISLDLAGFLIRWDDIQQSTRLAGCGFAFTNNVGKAEIRGFEIEAAYRPTDNLGLNLALSLNDSEITEPGEGTAPDKGDRLLDTPRWKVSGSGEYSFQLGQRNAFFRVDYQYFGESFSTFNQDDPGNEFSPLPFLRRDSFQIVNTRLAVELGRVNLALYIDNLFDEHANLGPAQSIVLEFPGRPRLITNRPRTGGIRMLVHF